MDDSEIIFFKHMNTCVHKERERDKERKREIKKRERERERERGELILCLPSF